MGYKLEALGQQTLKHRPELILRGRIIRLGLDVEVSRIEPLRPAEKLIAKRYEEVITKAFVCQMRIGDEDSPVMRA
jgi:hypothetical protein